ncbi:Hypothetical protein ERGA_CDS_08400 [Ehrlichia ruminantium str. Gardel]|nr:Hypothetical protein ERGA_CDS_08400 [Ehrlichia ruminantium str. Gardel]
MIKMLLAKSIHKIHFTFKNMLKLKFDILQFLINYKMLKFMSNSYLFRCELISQESLLIDFKFYCIN